VRVCCGRSCQASATDSAFGDCDQRCSVELLPDRVCQISEDWRATITGLAEN